MQYRPKFSGSLVPESVKSTGCC